ncbi:hypothetical protein QS62_06405 [Gallibacterium salpingitidis]|uniref:Carboxypeptidase regulatory-like domain-containing protein n=2 Tax=Gallibacterium salpingitidis TaxID=505341 RepID=A0A1A7NZ72_9PAST|nr:hypothetical protein QS62_06405 [Gallibacterium salpingitidis]
MMMRLKALVMMIGLLASPMLWAHSLHVIAQYDGNIVSGKAYYSDLTPAEQTYLAIFQNEDTQPTIEGITDKQGRFSYPLANGQNIKVVVEGEEGHKATTIADRITLQGQDKNEIALIREDIAALKDKIYFRDILGGIGYIFGILGGISLWYSYRLRKLLMNKR